MATAANEVSSEILGEKKISDQEMSYSGNSNQTLKDVERSPSNNINSLPPSTQSDNSGSEAIQFDELKAHRKLPSIFSPHLKKERIDLMKAIIRVEVLLIVIVLGILSIYWGGLASVTPNVGVLTVAVVDFDGQEVGNALTQSGIGSLWMLLTDSN
jgi:hypothetical protein